MINNCLKQGSFFRLRLIEVASLAYAARVQFSGCVRTPVRQFVVAQLVVAALAHALRVVQLVHMLAVRDSHALPGLSALNKLWTRLGFGACRVKHWFQHFQV